MAGGAATRRSPDALSCAFVRKWDRSPGGTPHAARASAPSVLGLRLVRIGFLRVRGLRRVQLHADLTMLARLALALSRARTRNVNTRGATLIV